ncbi:hypothetical protein ACHAXS_007848 [Conticribra weissflogii]
MELSIESFDIPDVQPKGFKSALVTPTHEEFRNSGHISFAPDTLAPHKHKANDNNANVVNKGVGGTSSAMSLNLRRVTPDRRSSSQLPDGVNRNVNGNVSSAASLTSRVTGKASIYTGATPVMRGGRSKIRARSPTSIERQQKMEDEYYVPGHGADEELEQEGEEVLDDGELPSLRRTGSAGSRSSSRLRSAAARSDREDGDSVGSRKVRLAPPSPQAALAAATAAALMKNANFGANDDEIEVDIAKISKKSKRSNLATPPMDNKDFEQLKVAGFWSQLDDLGTVDSSDTEETSNTRRSQVQGKGGDEEMPNDERKWMRSQTPPKQRDVYDGSLQQSQEKQLRWNLIEKAACFRSDFVENDEEHRELQRHQQRQQKEDDGDTSQCSSDTRDDIAKNNTFQTFGTENSRATYVTGVTGATGATSTQGASYQHTDNDEDEGVLGCITAALGTLCGYDSCSKDHNKEKALKIIEKDNARKIRQYEEHQNEIESAIVRDELEEMAKAVKKQGGVCNYDDDSIFDEDIAIELQYVSSPSYNTNNSTKDTENELDITTPHPADEDDGEGELSDEPPMPLSPRSESGTPMSPGKRKLNLKSVRNLLGRGKSKRVAMEEAEKKLRLQEQMREQNVHERKRAEEEAAKRAAAETQAASTAAAAAEDEARSPPRKTLITTTTQSGNEPVSGSFTKVTDAFSSTDEADKTTMEEDADPTAETPSENGQLSMPSLIPDLQDDEDVYEPQLGRHEKDEEVKMPYQNVKPKSSKSEDDEELQSESAAWSANRKNSYLRELAERAKQEFHAKKAAAAEVSDDQSAQAPALSSSKSEDAERRIADIKRSDTGVPQGTESSYHADYNSLSPTEKRKFLRLLNSGMSPSKATQAIVEEREEMQRAVLEEEEDDQDDDDELDSLFMEVENGEDDSEDKEGPRERDLPMDETVISTDPPGDILEGFSGESAELSHRDDAGEEEQLPPGTYDNDHVSKSEIGFNSSKSSPGEAYYDVATIPLVPAIVQAKSSSSSNRGTKKPSTEMDHDQDGKGKTHENKEAEEEELEVETGDDNYYDQKENNEESQYEKADVFEGEGDRDGDESDEDDSLTHHVDLIPYYNDLNNRSFEKESNEESLLLDKDNNRAKKSKLAITSISNLSVKIPSLRHVESSSDKRSSTPTIVSPSSRSNGYVQPVPSRDDAFIAASTSPRSPLGGSDERETKSDFAKTSKPLSSAISFIHRNSKWAKLDCDMDHSFSRSYEEQDKMLTAPSYYANDRERGMPSSFSSEKDIEGKAVTLTLELHESNEEFVSPDESDANTASKADSMVVSPDTTLSPNSPLDLASARRTPGQNATVSDFRSNPLDSGTSTKFVSPSPVYSPSIPPDSDDVTPRSYNLSAPRAQSTPAQSSTKSLPFIPISPGESDVSAVDDNASVMEQSHMMDQSYVTIGTSWTTASKSSRKRHKGAASKRLTEAKEAENQAGGKAKGWLGSIRDASSARNQTWDPEKGWVDYSEPEISYGRGESKHIGSLHVPMTAASKQQKAAPQTPSVAITKSSNQDVVVRFPPEWEEERKSMIKHDDSSKILASTFQPELDNNLLQDEESLFTSDILTVNTAAEVLSLTSYSVAPKRRVARKHKSKDKRKVKATQTKPTGWKESMEVATATIAGSGEAGHRWYYPNGLVDDYVGTDDNSDDVSELTKLTHLEKSPENKFHNSPSEGESIALSYQLSSVAEGMHEVASLSQENDDENIDLSTRSGEANADSNENFSIAPDEDSINASSSISKDNPIVAPATSSLFNSSGVTVSHEPVDASMDDAVPNDDSVPEDRSFNNGTETQKEANDDVSAETLEDNFYFEPKDGQSQESQLQENDENEKDALRQVFVHQRSTSKKSLNQWLAKSSNIHMKTQDAESEEAVTSREQITIESNSQSMSVGPTLESRNHSDEMEGPSDGSAHDIAIVKEKCTEMDKDLFRSSNISESFNHKFSDAEESELIMESFESLDSSDNLWLKQTPSRDSSIVSNNTDDASRPSVSERARAWMRAMEKQKRPAEPGEFFFKNQEEPREELNSSLRSSGTLNEKPSDPTQNVDPPSSQHEKAGQNAVPVVTRYLNAVSSRDATPMSENTGGNGKPKFEPVKYNANMTDQTSSSIKENDVIFHSTAMGIRLKRGEDGLVRVVSVTQATPGSSIKRDGSIEPDDIIREAAGIDLRQPITNSQWGEVVTKIRSAPRPMRFVTTSSSSNAEKVDKQFVVSSIKSEESEHYMTSGNLNGAIGRNETSIFTSSQSNQPEGHQILNSVAAAVAKIDSKADHRTEVPTSFADTDQSSRGSLRSETTVNSPQQPKETHKPNGFFNRIASCTNPNASYPSDHNNGQNEVPLSHLAFLRTNPTIVRVKDAASRRYPAFCGRPDTIFEEPGESEKDQDRHESPSHVRRSFPGVNDSNATSINGHVTSLKASITASSASGDNTAFLEKLALKSLVASKPSGNQAQHRIDPNTRHRINYPNGGHMQRGSEVGWPEGDTPEYLKESMDTMSSYSSTFSHSSFQSNKRKKDSVRQAELLAAAKVEAMMDELKDVESMEQCEI